MEGRNLSFNSHENEPHTEQPHIVICVPFKNYEGTLPITLKSISDNLSYDKKKITLVFYDDCSTDSSSQILKEFIAKNGSSYFDVLLRRGTEPTGGNVAKAINQCFELARTTESKYIVNVEADVEIPRDTLELLVDFIERNATVGMGSIPYVYVGGDQKTIEVDVTMGCTIISRQLLDEIDWRIDERFDRTNDLWLGAKAERLGFEVVSVRHRTAKHLKPFNYTVHVWDRFLYLPRYHYLLLREGLMTRRLLRSYIYYGSYLLVFILSFINTFSAIALGPLVIVGVWHYRSVRKFLYAFPVGLAMALGLIISVAKGCLAAITRSAHF